MSERDDRRMPLESALDVLARRRGGEVVVGTMTANAPWRERSASDRNLACLGFMGGASSLALGVALARPDVGVWVLDGDGSLLMQLGSLATIAGAAPANFVHVVFHNGVYETSGAQPLPSQSQVDFAAMAKAAGYRETAQFHGAEEFDAALDELLAAEGPTLIELFTQPAGRFFSARPTPPGSTPALQKMWPSVRDALGSGE